jgi:hypothetical protein
LLGNATIVIKRNPWFGSVEFHRARDGKKSQGQGIIDIVNTHRNRVEHGLVKLGYLLFLCFALNGIYKAMRDTQPNDEMYHRTRC